MLHSSSSQFFFIIFCFYHPSDPFHQFPSFSTVLHDLSRMVSRCLLMLIWILVQVPIQMTAPLENHCIESFVEMWRKVSKSSRVAAFIKRQIVVRIYRDYHLAQGRSRGSVSGSSGRFLHHHGDSEYATVRDSLGQDLPTTICRHVDMLVNFLERVSAVPPTRNDLEFIRQLGRAEDPNTASMLQRFQLLLHAAATERRIPARTLAEVISREVQHTLYQPASEFLVRTLPEEYRRQMLEWVAECKIQYRSRHGVRA